MLKTISIISSLLLATASFAGKDGKDYFVLKSTFDPETSSKEEICNTDFVISKGKDGKDYFVLKNGIVFSLEDYPCN